MATVALDVLRGLDYMHAHGMLHRDVKVCMHPQLRNRASKGSFSQR